MGKCLKCCLLKKSENTISYFIDTLLLLSHKHLYTYTHIYIYTFIYIQIYKYTNIEGDLHAAIVGPSEEDVTAHNKHPA